MNKLPTRNFVLLLFAPILLGQTGPVIQGAGGTISGYPAALTVAVFRPTAFNVTLVPNSSAGVNVADVSCFGGVTYATGTIDLSKGAKTLPLTIRTQQLGQISAGCNVTFGVLGGSDFPPLQAATTVISVPPSNDLTSAEPKGHPISTATGELYDLLPPDLALGGPLPLEFRRYYASEIRANGITTRIGTNWMHNFEWVVTFSDNLATVTRFGGRSIAFQLLGTVWQLVNPEQYGYQFVSVSNSTYQFVDPRSNLIYNFKGTATTLGLASIQDRNGNTLTVTASGTGSTQVTDGLGRSLTFTYDANNRLVKVADQTGRTVSFAYSNGGDLISVIDANGKIETYTYAVVNNIPGQMTARTLPLGNTPFTQTWDSLARVATQSDSRGNVTTFTYDRPQGSTSYADPLGVVVADTSRNYSDFLTYTDADNQIASVTYDGNQRRLFVIDRFGDKTARTFHLASGYVASETDALGNVTSYTWTAQSQGPLTFYVLTRTDYPDGTSVSTDYDGAGNRISVTDQAGAAQSGKVWKYSYNSRGQVTSATDPAGRLTTYNYNSGDATLASMTDGAGNVTLYSYDNLKRLNQIKFADGATRSMTYDNRDNVLKTTDERGKSRTFTFNDNGRPTGVTDALGKTSAIAYDTDERVSKRTGRNGQSTSFSYDVSGFLQTLTAPSGEVFTVSHDKHNRLSGASDASGKGVTFGYDKEDVLSSVTDGLSRKTTFSSDKLGHNIKVTTPLAEDYLRSRDQMGRVTLETDPTSVTTNFTYDSRGPLRRVAVGNSTVTLTRDDSKLLTGIADPNGNLWSFGYDSAGRLQSRVDPLQRSTSYFFDKRNRVTGVQTQLGSATLAYDSAGSLTQRKYSDGTTLNYTFDDDSRSTGGTGVSLNRDAEGAITRSNGLAITRDASGRIASIAYTPTKTVSYHYSGLGLLDSITDWLNGVTSFTYDAARALTGIRRPNGRSTQFVYDGDGRIQAINEDNGVSVAITRDAAGRPVSETRSLSEPFNLAPGTLSLAYDPASQVSGSTYDKMGRLTADGLRTYQWNLASQMTSYTGLDGSASATFDAFGLRTSRTAQGSTLNYVWNYGTTIPSLATVQDASGDRRYYIYLPDGSLLYAVDAATGARHFYHFGETGSTMMLTDDHGSITDTYGYTPFGETATQSGTTENPFTWQGQRGVMQEGATSLYYMRARYYDSATARFLSPDSIVSAHPLEVNPYQYARANPLSFADATGLAPHPASPLIPRFCDPNTMLGPDTCHAEFETSEDPFGTQGRTAPFKFLSAPGPVPENVSAQRLAGGYLGVILDTNASTGSHP